MLIKLQDFFYKEIGNISVLSDLYFHVRVHSFHNRRDGNDGKTAVGDAALASSGSPRPSSSTVSALIASAIAATLLAASSS